MTVKRVARLFLATLFLVYGIDGLLALPAWADVHGTKAEATHTPPATEPTVAAPSVFGPIQAAIDLLKAGGPLAAAVLMGWFALRKDKEKSDAVDAANKQFQAIHDQMVEIIESHTAATTKLEGTVSALKDLLNFALERPPTRNAGTTTG